jgi:hypothetical protein
MIRRRKAGSLPHARVIFLKRHVQPFLLEEN